MRCVRLCHSYDRRYDLLCCQQASMEDPRGFWEKQAEAIVWHRPFSTGARLFRSTVWCHISAVFAVLDCSNPPFYRWFVGGQTNGCFNAVDRHVEAGRGSQAALIYDSPVTNTIKTITYAELLAQVERFAGLLRSHDVKTGDRVGKSLVGALIPL